MRGPGSFRTTMTPLRVLHVTPYTGDAWAYGGIPRVVDALTDGLARRGHDVTICATDACDGSRRLPATDGSAQPPIASRPARVTTRVFPNLSNRLAYHAQAFLPIGMDGFLRRHAQAFDLAHLHACRNLPGVIAARHLRAAGVPYVLAPNGTAPNIERRHTAKRLFDALWGQRVLDGAARVIAVTEAERQQLRKLGVRDEAIGVVPNPVALDGCSSLPRRGALRAAWGLGDAPIVMFLGKLTPRKRVDVLIRAFANLRDDPRYARARLVIAGNDMGSGSQVRALVHEARVSADTLFTGLLSGAARLEALIDADVLVYPSQDEIFGLVPLEALLCGTPVIVADDCGCGEVVAQVGGGLVTRVGDVPALTTAIRVVLDAQPAWRCRAALAAAEVGAEYGADRVCARLEELYGDVLDRSRAAGRARHNDRDTRAPAHGVPA
jgi:glycosyltransferase involved in cell wall biosynthesis